MSKEDEASVALLAVQKREMGVGTVCLAGVRKVAWGLALWGMLGIGTQWLCGTDEGI